MDLFTYEVALLFFRMRVAAGEYLGQGRHSSGRRSILKSLGREGPQTVPAMARVRAVSRQHIQTLVNELKEEGLVAARDNPAHRRSKLIALTASGKRLLAHMSAREERLLEQVAEGIPRAEFERATRLLRELRSRLEGAAWREAAADARPPSPGRERNRPRPRRLGSDRR